MPTPIEHLAVAEQLLASPDLSAAVLERLEQNAAVRGAFFFGHIAPDVQVISRQPREATHFFTIPPTNRSPAYARMFTLYPWMGQPDRLPAVHAAFISGYISHLLLDEYWVQQIFHPIFGPDQTWGDWRERLLLHNVLRAWLDRRNLDRLRNGIGELLRQAEPDNWLPFATDADLYLWRDLVADQFFPGALIRTVEILARRSRVPDVEFQTLLEPDVLQERVFSRVSLARLERFYDEALARTRDLTLRYMDGCLAGKFE